MNRNNTTMLKYYFKIALRNIFRQRLASSLILVSLCTGLVTFALVTSYVSYEKSYDRVFPDYERIYRVTTDIFVDGELKLSKPMCERSVGSSLVEKYPEVINTGYLVKTLNPEYKIGENLFKNENVLHASPGILELFSIDLIQGNPNDVLNKPYKILISQSSAEKYFGNEDPIGKIVHKYPAYEYVIEGVFKDIPAQAHFKADMLLSFHNNMHLPPPLKSAWGETNFYTYLKIKDNVDLTALEKNINQLAIENKQSHFDKTNSSHKYGLQALKTIHLNSHLNNEITTNSRADYLYVLLVVGLLIVFAAGLNYLYFSFVKSTEKALNTGIQKMVGANNSSVIGMSLIESIILHTMALVISLFICILIAPFISGRFGINIDLSFSNYYLIGSIGVILIFSVLLNGLIPALRQNAIKSIDLLKVKQQTVRGKISLRQLLVSAQFIIVIGIIICILGINKQVNYLVNKEKGLSIENKLIVQAPSNLRRNSQRINNIDAFEQELIRHSNIKTISMGSAVPGETVAHNFTFSEVGSDKTGKAGLIITDKNFIENYSIPLIHGKNFENGLKGCLVNKSCLPLLGYKEGKDAVGKMIQLIDDSGMQEFTSKIIGVVGDFNFQTAKEKPGATILFDWTENMVWGNYTISLNTSDFSSVLPFIKKRFEATFINYPFEYFILEDSYKTELKSELQLLKILQVFVLVALVLSMINLFSMAWHNTSARIKEIGIRKVNGAKVSEILTMLNKDFIKWVAIAFAVACPIAYHALNLWLENFAYKTALSWWIFALAGTLALGIALLTVSWQSYKAAIRNPIESLRYE